MCVDSWMRYNPGLEYDSSLPLQSTQIKVLHGIVYFLNYDFAVDNWNTVHIPELIWNRLLALEYNTSLQILHRSVMNKGA